jgi:Uma2 family endonuclease
MTALHQEDVLPTGLNVDEFLEWADTTDGRFELVDGDVRAMAPASQTHGLIFAEMARVIGNHLIKSGGRCRVVVEPGVKTRVRSTENWRIPELAVICKPPVVGQLMVENPILIVEVLSPSNYKATWSNVYAYCAIPSVREILILQSLRVDGWLLRRDADNNWPDDPLPIKRDGQIVLETIDLSILLTDAYATTPFADMTEPDGSPST